VELSGELRDGEVRCLLGELGAALDALKVLACLAQRGLSAYEGIMEMPLG
jgi:hypothetical protein